MADVSWQIQNSNSSVITIVNNAFAINDAFEKRWQSPANFNSKIQSLAVKSLVNSEAFASRNQVLKSLFSEKENYLLVLNTAMPLNSLIDEEVMEDQIKELIVCKITKALNRKCQLVFMTYFSRKSDHIFCRLEVFLNTTNPVTVEEVEKIKEHLSSTKFKFGTISKIVLEDIVSNNSNPSPKEEIEFWKSIKFDDRLLTDDNYLNNESVFKRFYGIDSQVRMVLSPLQSAIQTAGKRMVHSVLFGPPACGKTSVLNHLEHILGKENILKLDAPTTTKAGIEKLFLNSNIPPVVILEEAEKANEDWLRNWLSLLDERSEIRKVSHKETIVKDIDILFYCTVNDSERFNNLLDGALASRCKNKIYFPRPTMETIEKILYRDIEENGGMKEWVQPALQLAKDLNIDDPRVIISFLAGGNRLLDGSYQEDKKKCINTSLIT